MKTRSHFSSAEATLVKPGALFATPAPKTLAVATALVLFLGLAALLILRNGSDESVVQRCDKSALAAAGPAEAFRGHESQWRRERQAAFRRCIDESLQWQHKVSP